ncbi:PucR family transcriptional regulator [Cohnella caldifontis]|uniref:PucR family transcriptional regulator n=1 Tax=Cohnella caldifontis TaxID=3027471 RepID=UPI0023ED2D5A|nr:PucR family transcriptional regulator [Cohnella sp. YIM B05605]
METSDYEGFRVRDLFDIPHFKDAVMLGGDAGLERAITRINVMEVPDVVDWVRPGEFLMTTGYPFKHDPEVLVTLIAELAQRGVVALGVKTKRFFDAVPPAAVEAANRYGMPLIELPPGTTFSDVVREVMERVLVSESKDLSVLQGRVQRLSRVLLRGDGLPAFLEHLERLIGHPVALLDPGDRWTASPAAEALCAGIEEAGWAELRADRDRETCFLPIRGRSMRVRIAKATDDIASGHLLILMEHEQECGVADMLTLIWAGRLIGFEISNLQARQIIEAKYVDQFLQDWMAGRMVSAVDLRLRAEACGCPLQANASYLVGVVSFRDRQPDVRELQGLAKRFHSNGGNRPLEARWTVMEGELAVLIAFPPSMGETFVPERTESIDALWQSMQSVLQGKQATLCLGRTAENQDAVPDSYRDAKRAAEVRGICGLQDSVVRYGELGVYFLLYRLLETEELAEFRRLYLQPLQELDVRNQGSLMQTLRTYFQCGCNAKETAERMFVHYNTVNYRLERIKDELGQRLDDPETKLLLQLALKVGEISETSSSAAAAEIAHRNGQGSAAKRKAADRPYPVRRGIRAP